jgi:quercetin dioxygenase-like cupin family protein
MRAAFIVRSEQREEPLNVLGTKVTALGREGFLGDLQITLQSGDEGMGPPPHSHAWDESFYVTKGQVIFTCNGSTWTSPRAADSPLPHGAAFSKASGLTPPRWL